MVAHFDLKDFLPYLLNQAAEASSAEFQTYYRDTYGMLRTEWRVMFHLWRYGEMTAKDICDRASLHKTKVSRAVSALESKRFLTRMRLPDDRRNELLQLTRAGKATAEDLTQAAADYEARLQAEFGAEEWQVLVACLKKIASPR